MLREEYPDRPRLCHGDCATTNILVDQKRIVALIDWEWARGGDPAANIAYWAFWQDDIEALDALLAGYQADEPARFRKRVLAYRVYTAIDLIHVYAEHGGPDNIRFCRQKLETALKTRPWAVR
jgi:aminoglycoside phosphotransferase (APT) family kinase protein